MRLISKVHLSISKDPELTWAFLFQMISLRKKSLTGPPSHWILVNLDNQEQPSEFVFLDMVYLTV